MSTPLSILGLKPRTLRRLTHGQWFYNQAPVTYSTVDDVMEAGGRTLLKIKWFGRGSLADLRAALLRVDRVLPDDPYA